MKVVEVPNANQQLRQIMDDVEHDMVVLTRSGKPVAAMISVEDMDAEGLCLSTNPQFLDILRKSLRALASGQAVSLADMRRRFGEGD